MFGEEGFDGLELGYVVFIDMQLVIVQFQFDQFDIYIGMVCFVFKVVVLVNWNDCIMFVVDQKQRNGDLVDMFYWREVFQYV